MITSARLARALGVLGVIGFMALATTSPSIATQEAYQDPALDLASSPSPFDDDEDSPATLLPKADEEPKSPPPAPSPIDAAPAPQEPEPVKDLPPAPAADEVAEPLVDDDAGLDEFPASPAEERSNPLPPAREPASIAAPRLAPQPERSLPVNRAEPAAPPVDDPDAEARTFVERNRREAESQLKTLRAEAAQLRSRLARLEAGIRRWEALADALERSEGRVGARVVEGGEILESADGRAFRGRIVPGGSFVVPGPGPGVVIQSQPITRADYVPAPQPR